MIRVILRHVDDGEGYLVGDFPPDQINDLLTLFKNTDVYVGDHEDCRLFTGEGSNDTPTQWTLSDEQRPRVIFEVLLEG